MCFFNSFYLTLCFCHASVAVSCCHTSLYNLLVSFVTVGVISDEFSLSLILLYVFFWFSIRLESQFLRHSDLVLCFNQLVFGHCLIQLHVAKLWHYFCLTFSFRHSSLTKVCDGDFLRRRGYCFIFFLLRHCFLSSFNSLLIVELFHPFSLTFFPFILGTVGREEWRWRGRGLE